MSAYYNEIDPWAAALLVNLIKAGHIAPGDVDTRSIEDVKPDDLRPYKQCHFFAGAGVWSAALRRAGWPDDKRVWTGSAPCQPFSAAGAGAGFDDERHLWPALHYLVQQCHPERIYGEQVASKAVDPWLDLVHADLEGLGYAFGACAFPSAGVGAPHIRDRTYWLADVSGERRLGRQGVSTRCDDERLGHADNQGLQGHAGHDGAAGRGRSAGSVAAAGVFGGMANSDGGTDRRESEILTRANVGGLAQSDGRSVAEYGPPGPTNGAWRDADWLLCRDGKWRPVEPGTFPLAHGAPARVGRLRAYGNACNLEAAYEFIMATIDY